MPTIPSYESGYSPGMLTRQSAGRMSPTQAAPAGLSAGFAGGLPPTIQALIRRIRENDPSLAGANLESVAAGAMQDIESGADPSVRASTLGRVDWSNPYFTSPIADRLSGYVSSRAQQPSQVPGVGGGQRPTQAPSSPQDGPIYGVDEDGNLYPLAGQLNNFRAQQSKLAQQAAQIGSKANVGTQQGLGQLGSDQVDYEWKKRQREATFANNLQMKQNAANNASHEKVADIQAGAAVQASENAMTGKLGQVQEQQRVRAAKELQQILSQDFQRRHQEWTTIARPHGKPAQDPATVVKTLRDAKQPMTGTYMVTPTDQLTGQPGDPMQAQSDPYTDPAKYWTTPEGMARGRQAAVQLGYKPEAFDMWLAQRYGATQPVQGQGDPAVQVQTQQPQQQGQFGPAEEAALSEAASDMSNAKAQALIQQYPESQQIIVAEVRRRRQAGVVR